MGYKEVRDGLKGFLQKILVPIIALLNKTGVTPNFLTWLGFVLLLPSLYFLIKGKFIAAAFIIIFSTLFDMLDGALARMTDKKTKFGGFLDSTVDRFAEGVLYLGLLIYYTGTNNFYGIILSYLTMFLSFCISYIRARAGGLRIDCEVGLFTRPERLVALIVGLLSNLVVYMLAVISAVSLITVIQRMWLVYTEAQKLDIKK
ncbi:MAG: CDP-alcohol phosphatidyltransferase family protein [Candidatus Goldiibacteriota bacterium]|jgi:CDP-diacylglycerol--glycerol-3-phosphate 3-phosphatidyltransferase